MLATALLTLAFYQATKGCLTCRVDFPAPGLFQKDKDSVVELAPFAPSIPWTEAIPSWNVSHPERAELTVEARVVYPDHVSKYFSFGTWTGSSLIGARHSVGGQRDEDGTVLTDTLRISRPGGLLQFRLSSKACGAGPLPKLLRLFVNFSGAQPVRDGGDPSAERPAAWGEVIDPPQFAQGDYPGGKGLCSPTSVAMVLDY